MGLAKCKWAMNVITHLQLIVVYQAPDMLSTEMLTLSTEKL